MSVYEIDDLAKLVEEIDKRQKRFEEEVLRKLQSIAEDVESIKRDMPNN
jgi:hypothetical protein